MTNEELMVKYAAGDAAAFDELFERIHQKVYDYVVRHLHDKNERDDLVQNIFIKLHQTKEKYNPAYALDAWLFTIARSVLFDHLRKSSKMSFEEYKDFLVPDREQVDVSQELAALPLKSRTIVEMKYIEDLDFEEIAKRIETSPANVRQIVSRAIRFLRNSMEINNGK